MDPTTLWMMAKPILAGQLRHALGIAFGYLLAKGALQSDQQSGFIEIGMSLAGWAVVAGWSWWNGAGKARAGALLQKMTGTDNHKDAVEAAKALPEAAAVDTKNKAITASAVTGKVVTVLIAAFVLSAFLAGAPAMAQLKTPAQIQQDIDAKLQKLDLLNNQIAAKSVAAATGQPAPAALSTIMDAIAKPFKDLADFVSSDAGGAATLATQVPNLQDVNGRACWIKMQDAGAIFQAHPVPVTLKAMTDFEALRLLQMTANNLCAYTPCTVVFSDGANLATAVASAVGGALTSNAVPSLTQLCARIPQISPMLPAAVTAIAAAPPPSPTPMPTPSPTPTP